MTLTTTSRLRRWSLLARPVRQVVEAQVYVADLDDRRYPITDRARFALAADEFDYQERVNDGRR